MDNTRERASRAGLGAALALAVALAGVLAGAVTSAAQADDRVGKITMRMSRGVSVAPQTIGRAVASCRRGEVLVGGGTYIDSPTGAVQTSAPIPGSSRRWHTMVFNPSYDSAREIFAYAYCGARASRDRVGAITRVAGPLVATSSESAGAAARARCSTGRLVGGGAQLSGSDVLLQSSSPNPARVRSWLARSMATVMTAHQVRAYAFCAKPSRRDRVGRVAHRFGPASAVGPSAERNAVAFCRPGERLIGGAGEAGPGAFLVSSAPDPARRNRWVVRGRNFGGSVVQLRAVAICAKRG